MTVVRLLQEIKSLLTEALGALNVEPGYVTPEIHLGYLPFETIPGDIPAGAAPLENTTKKAEPFVIIRALTGEDEAYEVDTAKVVILVGTEDVSESGYMDVLHLFENLRFAIARKHAIGDFMPVGKVKWTLPEEQPWPIWNGIIETTWSLPGIEKEDVLHGIFG